MRQETNNALEELKKGQDDILDHQTRLKSSQELLGKFMDGNINIISEMETILKARVEELHNVTSKLQTHLGECIPSIFKITAAASLFEICVHAHASCIDSLLLSM